MNSSEKTKCYNTDTQEGKIKYLEELGFTVRRIYCTSTFEICQPALSEIKIVLYIDPVYPQNIFDDLLKAIYKAGYENGKYDVVRPIKEALGL